MSARDLYNSISSLIHSVEEGNLTYFDQKYISEGINFMIGEENQQINAISRDLLFSIDKLMKKINSKDLDEENMKVISENLNKMLNSDINNFKYTRHLFLGWYIYENLIDKK